MTPLQLGLVVDYAPAWLGPALLAVGVVLLLAGSVSISDLGRELGPGHVVAFVIMGAGLALPFGPLYLRYPGVVVLCLSFLGRAIEGVALVRTYQKYVTTVREWELQGGLKGRIFASVVGLCLAIVAVGAGAVYLAFYAEQSSLGRSIQLFRTLVILGTSLAAVGWRVNRVREAYSYLFYAGFVLTVVGTELQNLSLAFEIAVFAAGELSYVVGATVALHIWSLLATDRYDRLQSVTPLSYYTLEWLRE